MKKLGLNIRLVIMYIAVILIILISSFFWNSYSQKQQAEASMLEEAEALAATMDSVWNFIEINQNKIVIDAQGNHALYCVTAAKSISSLFTYESDYVIHYTNKTTRKNIDAPDEFETRALDALSNDGTPVYYGLTTYENKPVFRYLKPLFITESCLDCHGEPAGELDTLGYKKEGLAIGDLAGAISMVVPVEPFLDISENAFISQMFFFTLVLSIGLIIMYVGSRKWIVAPVNKLVEATRQIASGDLTVSVDNKRFFGELEELANQFNHMAQQLNHSYGSLESQVMLRTNQLAKLNDLLNEEKLKLEQANEILSNESQQKSDFLATVSHDLRTPLTSILAFAEILEQSLRRANNEQDLEAVLETKENAKILLAMIDNILETARLETGGKLMHLEQVDLFDLVGSSESSIRFLAERKGLTFIVSLHSGIPIVIADPEKVRRIIENLVSNAIKFTRFGGSVELTITQAKPSLAQNPAAARQDDTLFDREEAQQAYDSQQGTETVKDWIAITVSDTGRGIRAEQIPSVFEKFSQVDDSPQKRYRGNGLGLSIVKEFAQMHGGYVTVESEYTQGSTFAVYLPVAPSEWKDDLL